MMLIYLLFKTIYHIKKYEFDRSFQPYEQQFSGIKDICLRVNDRVTGPTQSVLVLKQAVSNIGDRLYFF
jgi:hypothetical protein